MNVTNSSGVYELDANGLVIYSSLKAEDGTIRRAYDQDGLHFFSRVLPFSNVTDFRSRFENFRESNTPSMTFDFTYKNEVESSTIRVLLARLIRGEESASYLVYVRPAW